MLTLEEVITPAFRFLKEPIFAELFKISKRIIKAYDGDLGHDVLDLAKSEAGQYFMWAPRESGTHLILVRESNWDLFHTAVLQTQTKIEHWHLIKVLKVRGNGHADGFVIPINASLNEHVFSVWKKALEY